MTKRITRVIGVTGMPGSGKSLFAQYATQRGYETVIMGDVIRAKVIEEGFEPTPDNTQRVMVQLREKMGEDAVAHLTCKAIDSLIEEGSHRIIIDGIRSQVEVDYFKNHLNDEFVIVAIHVDPTLRYERLRLRGRKDAPLTEEDFKKRDKSELKLGLGETIAFSNYVILNNRTLNEFRDSSVDLLNELEKGEK